MTAAFALPQRRDGPMRGHRYGSSPDEPDPEDFCEGTNPAPARKTRIGHGSTEWSCAGIAAKNTREEIVSRGAQREKLTPDRGDRRLGSSGGNETMFQNRRRFLVLGRGRRRSDDERFRDQGRRRTTRPAAAPARKSSLKITAVKTASIQADWGPCRDPGSWSGSTPMRGS